MAGVVVLSLLAVPLAITPRDFDTFGAIKEVAFRLEAIVALLLLTLAALLGGTDRFRAMLRDRGTVMLLAAAVIATIVTALFSTHRVWTLQAVITVIASLLLFLLAWYVSPVLGGGVFVTLAAVGALESVLVAMQATGTWQPFVLRDTGIVSHTGTLGNPNLVGTYLAIVAITLAAATAPSVGWRRWVCGIGGLIALGGAVASGTRTAVLAVGVTVVAMAIRRSAKHAAVAAVVLAVLFTAGVVARIPAALRLVDAVNEIRAGDWEAATSRRMGTFFTTFEMFRERPLVGLGPGTYKYHYMKYRARLPQRYLSVRMRHARTNAAEAHNEHLQYLAETGLVGYAVFAAALVYLAWGRVTGTGNPARIAAAVAMPLAVVVAVLTLAQFPLQSAASRHLIITLAGLLAGWKR